MLNCMFFICDKGFSSSPEIHEKDKQDAKVNFFFEKRPNLLINNN